MPQVTPEMHRAQELSDIKAVLELPAGRRLLWRIMSQCKPFHDYQPSMTERELQRALGARSIGLWLMDEIESNFPAWFNMTKLENTGDNALTIREPENDSEE